MDMMRPIVTRIGEIGQRHAYQAMLGRAGHGMRQMIPMTPGITSYSMPGDTSGYGRRAMSQIYGMGQQSGLSETMGMANRGMQMVQQNAPGMLDKVGGAVHKVGGILGAVESGIGTALRIGKTVAPFLPLAAALL
jgi:hypothetical protein